MQHFDIGHRRGNARQDISDADLALRPMRRRLAAGNGGRQGQHRRTSVRLNGHRGRIHRGQLGRIDVDSNDVAGNIESGQEAVTRADLSAHQQYHVGVGQCLLARRAHDRRAQGQRVRFGKYPLAGIGGKHRSPDVLRDVGQWLASADRTAADQNEWALCLREKIRSLLDRSRVGHG